MEFLCIHSVQKSAIYYNHRNHCHDEYLWGEQILL